MADESADATPRVPLADVVRSVVGAVVAGGLVYLVASSVSQIESLSVLRDLPWLPIVAAIVAAAFAFVVSFRDVLARTRARRAATRVDEALKSLTDDSGTVASVSTEQVAKTVSAQIPSDQLTRLVEQRKQQLLLNNQLLRPALDYMLANWQPLPRDIKRAMNRFYVSLLIAYNRGLLKDPPVVSGHQLAKWLILSERWPQLGRALAVWPKQIKALEENSTTGVGESDRYDATLAAIAPLYLDDAALRAFLRSQPRLAPVLQRLVEYGAAQPVGETAETPEATGKREQGSSSVVPARHA